MGKGCHGCHGVTKTSTTLAGTGSISVTPQCRKTLEVSPNLMLFNKIIFNGHNLSKLTLIESNSVESLFFADSKSD